MHGLLNVPCDAGFAAPLALGFVVMLSRFTNSGVEPVAANMCSEIEWSSKEVIVICSSVETAKNLLEAR